MTGYEFDFGDSCCTKEYPPASQIPPRCFEPLDDEKEVRSALGLYNKKRKITLALIKEKAKAAEADLRRDIERYEDILKRGDAAMSDWDLSMGYTAQTSGLPLKHNHIGYNKGRLRILKHWLEKFRPAAKHTTFKKTVQMELF